MRPGGSGITGSVRGTTSDGSRRRCRGCCSA
jgi:hypothetical protein